MGSGLVVILIEVRVAGKESLLARGGKVKRYFINPLQMRWVERTRIAPAEMNQLYFALRLGLTRIWSVQ